MALIRKYYLFNRHLCLANAKYLLVGLLRCRRRKCNKNLFVYRQYLLNKLCIVGEVGKPGTFYVINIYFGVGFWGSYCIILINF